MKRSTRAAVAAFAAAIVAALLSIITLTGTASGAESAEVTFARDTLRNCQLRLALPNLTSAERNDANRCVSVQTKLIAQLTAAPTPSPTTTTTQASPSPTLTTSPAPSPTVTTTPPPPPGPRVCPDFPAMPDGSCTGVPPGVVLHTCPYFINTPGTYDSCLFADGVSIDTSNVTITRSRVVGRVAGTTMYEPTRGLSLVDVEIDGSTVDDPYGQAGVGQDGWSCLRCNVHHTGRGASIGDSVTIRDSWFHDFRGAAGAHMSAAGSNGGANNTLVHNLFDCVSVTGLGACSGALVAYGDFAPVDNWLVQNNLLQSPGSYCLYAGSGYLKPYPHATRMQFIDNLWSRKYSPVCGQYGPVTGWEPNTGSVWSGNRYTDGEPILV